MDDALRYQQQLQLCKQLHVLQQQLCEQTQLSDDLLASLYALHKFCSTPSCCLVQIAVEFPEVSHHGLIGDWPATEGLSNSHGS